MKKTIQIQTTTFCPARCKICPRSVPDCFLNKVRAYMLDDVFSCIVTEIKDNEIVVPKLPLYMQAEPLTDPKLTNRIVEIKERIGSQVEQVELSTNGVLLNSEKSKQLIEASVGISMTVWLSFNGTTPEEYAQVNSLPYDVVLDNILRFLKDSDDAKITRKIMTSTEEAKAEAFWTRNAAKYKIKRLPKLKFFKPNNRAGNVPSTSGGSSENWKKCIRPKRWLHFNWNGDAILCCNDYENEVVFGNIVDLGIMEIVKRIPKILAKEAQKETFICNRCNKRYK